MTDWVEVFLPSAVWLTWVLLWGIWWCVKAEEPWSVVVSGVLSLVVSHEVLPQRER